MKLQNGKVLIKVEDEMIRKIGSIYVDTTYDYYKKAKISGIVVNIPTKPNNEILYANDIGHPPPKKYYSGERLKQHATNLMVLNDGHPLTEAEEIKIKNKSKYFC